MGAVGFDISCGVRPLTTSLTRGEIERRQHELADMLFESILAGLGSTGAVVLAGADMDAMLAGGAAWAVAQGWGETRDLERIEENGRMAGARPEAAAAWRGPVSDESPSSAHCRRGRLRAGSKAAGGGTLMDGKTVVLTGGTSGIGEVAATELARQGARIILVARDRERASQTLAHVGRAGPGLAHRVVYANLASIAETRRAAAEIAVAEPRVDVLINNAGALFNRRQTSPDGLEMTFAVNHMAYFAMTEGLRDALIRSAPARIVSTASGAHRGAALDFDDLQSQRAYSGFRAYARSKLCNILFNRELARRLEGSGVTANSLHPGFVATRFGANSGGLTQALMPLAKLGAISAAKGAETIVHLASSPDVAAISGGYFYKRQPETPSPAAQDDAAASRLWAESERIAARAASQA